MRHGTLEVRHTLEAFSWPPDAAPQVRLSEAVESGVPLAWHEAVAIVRVLAVSAQLQPPTLELPGMSEILIDTSGNLLATGRASVGVNAVPALRSLLDALLDEQTAPPELVNLSRDSSPSMDLLGINEFTAKLTFYARPDDSAELANFAVRGLTYRESRLRDEALSSLAAKARAATPAVEAPVTAMKSRFSRRFGRWSVAGVLLVVGLGAAATWRLSASSAGGTVVLSQPVAELARRVQYDLTIGMATLQQQLGLAPQPEAPRGRDRELPAIRRRTPRPPGSDERVPLPAELAYGLRSPSADAAALPTPSEGPRINAPEPPPDTTVYSAQDMGVTAPTLARPQMPAERIEGVSQERAGELELLVGLDGRVEQARLVPASNRYQDRMMVSAAKTWRFAPASRDGRPVRYRFRMPITW